MLAQNPFLFAVSFLIYAVLVGAPNGGESRESEDDEHESEYTKHKFEYTRLPTHRDSPDHYFKLTAQGCFEKVCQPTAKEPCEPRVEVAKRYDPDENNGTTEYIYGPTKYLYFEDAKEGIIGVPVYAAERFLQIDMEHASRTKLPDNAEIRYFLELRTEESKKHMAIDFLLYIPKDNIKVFVPKSPIMTVGNHAVFYLGGLDKFYYLDKVRYPGAFPDEAAEHAKKNGIRG